VAVNERGAAKDLDLVTSSGYPLLDRAAIDTVRRWALVRRGSATELSLPLRKSRSASACRAPELSRNCASMRASLKPARIVGIATLTLSSLAAAERPVDRWQSLERTCFQTGRGYDDSINVRSDVAIVYGIDPGLRARIESWRARDYRIHVMTGVSWGNYQDYLYGRFDGINHEDEAQTDRHGEKISHGGDVYYMSPGTNYGRFLCVGVQRALETGIEAVHLEEPEFWVRGGYSPGFKREWEAFYGEAWEPPHGSVDAQWRASKLKYYLYRRALQQVFDFIQDWNQVHDHQVRCYVPTHSLLNYAHWRIVSPEASLAQLQGCDGYIAQVWTGTSRTPNLYRGELKERTFETAFLEYGAMQNLVRATSRTVWYLNDPIEDNPNHDWEDYRSNWESTLVASLLQPEVWRYEVMPWPNRIFNGRYPNPAQPEQRIPIPAAYATEVQVVINALNDLQPHQAKWDGALDGVGVLVSDSLMFQRGQPNASDPHLSHVYGLALPLLKRGVPVEPVQLENAPLSQALNRYQVLLLSYHGQKPLSPEVHEALAQWVRNGGTLVVIDDDSDPYNKVREWWNDDSFSYSTPRQHLFEQLGLDGETTAGHYAIGRGRLAWHQVNPATLAHDQDGDARLMKWLHKALPSSKSWPLRNHLLLRRGPYVVAAGLDESPTAPVRLLKGRFISLFDPDLELRRQVSLPPGSRWFLLDLDNLKLPAHGVLASACKAWKVSADDDALNLVVEGIGNTQAIVLARTRHAPSTVKLEGQEQPPDYRWDANTGLLWIRFTNEAQPRSLRIAR
jgi:hypothetical protein